MATDRLNVILKLKEIYQLITLGGDAELELLDSLTNNIPDKRIAAYFFEEYDFKIPPLKSDFFFIFKIVSLLFLGFSKKQNLDENDEIFYITYRAGIVFTFSIFIFISFHDLYAIASRLSDISAPFECIIIAYFIINFPNFHLFC